MKIEVYSAKEKQPAVKIRRAAVATLGLVGVLGVGAIAGGEASAISINDSMMVNPVYEQYMADVAAGNGSAWKLIPNKYIPKEKIGGKGSDVSLPTAYSLVEAGYGTPVKNQGGDGDCWAFATTTAIESNLKKTQGIDYEFSPKQIDYLLASGSPYYSYVNRNFEIERNLGDGGNFLLASYPLSGQYAPTGEAKFFAKMQANDANLAGYVSWEDFQNECTIDLLLGYDAPAYTEAMGTEQVLGDKSDYVVTEYEYLSGDTDKIGGIKENVYKYGAAYVGTIAPEVDNCYDKITKTIIDRGTICGKEHMHAMAIVGWDDNHAYTDPVSGVVKTGAFLLQNSWGSDDLLDEYDIDVDLLMKRVDTTGMTDEEIAARRDAAEEFLNTYTAPEYVWLGYDFNDSYGSVTNFGAIQEVRKNDYARVYDSVTQMEGLGGNPVTEANYNFTTDGATEVIDAIAVSNHVLYYDDPIEYVIYVDPSNTGTNYQKVGSVTIPAGKMGQEFVDVSSQVVVNGPFKVKMEGYTDGQKEEFHEEDLMYHTISLYTNDDTLVVPNTSTEEALAVPSTGLYTGDGAGAVVAGVLAATGALAAGALGAVAYKNRKHLFRKIGFEKKEF